MKTVCQSLILNIEIFYFACASASFGNTIFRMMAINAAGTIPEPPKIRLIEDGSCASTAELEPIPYPRPRATETIVTFLGVTGHLVISWIPLC